MPKVLTEAEVDPAIEQVNAAIDLAEQQGNKPNWPPVSTMQQYPDLADGGKIGDVTLFPTQNGRRVAAGRPTVRRAWMWNGTESMLPLGWNPEGTRHDGARPYLLKRHCLCCHLGGFRGTVCPACAKSNCAHCAGGTDRTTENQLGNGQVIKGWLIPNFYLSKETVPFPARFYGAIDCFLEFCTRKGSRGFLTEQDMRVHARSRHRLEYQAFTEAIEAQKKGEIDTLRTQVALLTAAVTAASQPTPVAETQPAPLYVGAKPTSPKRSARRQRRQRRNDEK